MKRTITIVAAALAMLIGGASCSKENNTTTQDTGMKGNLKITFGVMGNVQDDTRAATSTNVKPKTSWANVKELSLVLVDGANIADVRAVTSIPASGNAQISQLFSGIVSGKTYDAYLIANFNQTTTPFGAGKVNPSAAIGNGLRGTPINSLLLNLATASSIVGNDPTGSTVYGEPSEIFLAKQTGIVVNADQTTTVATPFALTRAESLLRIRINQAYNPTAYPGSYDNSKVDFKTAGKTAARLRLHGTGIQVANAANATVAPYGIAGITTTAASSSNVFYSGKQFKTAADFNASDYDNASASMGLGTDYTLWNEYLILPGGSATNGSLKFNVAVSGWAPAGYVAYNIKTGNSVTMPAGGGLVSWVGQVTGAVKPNDIIELNLHLLTQGIAGDDIPPVTGYGNIDVKVNLIPWGDTTYVPMPL